MDLIYAEATPPGRGGVSVIRLSGISAKDVAERMVGQLAQARHAYYRPLRDQGEILDHIMVIWFEAGSSFTGEEVVELHLHGAPVVGRRVAMTLCRYGAREAEAGEFTRRAFLNGRVGLAEVEGLGDLLAAETEAQRQLALRSAGGELAQQAEAWRKMLIRAGALVEASVDFADEDVPEDIPDEVFDIIGKLCSSFEQQIGGFPAAERIRNGFEVAIVGPPNAGKSSLVNRIGRRDVALVSDIAGTTRDVLELRIDLKGLAVTLLDTAGLRDALDPVELMGVERARRRAKAAELRVHLINPGETADTELWRDGDLLVLGKSDLRHPGEGLNVSAESGEGIDDLLLTVYEKLSERVVGAGLFSHRRQLEAVSEAYAALIRVGPNTPELVAELIRQAVASLDRLVGRIGAEDYLDEIFSSFCIGK